MPVFQLDAVSGSKRTAMGEAAAVHALSHLHDVRECIRNSVSAHLLPDIRGPSAKTCEGAADESGYRRGASAVEQQLYGGRISAVVRVN
uniref:Uncharacterized protein n=1 Tax=Oryza meridionalis TaxID=40149 RepID=A0A0E0EA95_9ORYZ